MKDLPTIKDVATRAGVGIATVSRVLNDHPSIRPDTRTKVLTAIAELGYKPNQTARNMVTGTSHTLGLIIPDIRQSFFPDMARGFEDEAQHAGYGVILADTDENSQREQAYLNMLLGNRVAGVAFSGTATPAARIRQLHKNGMPVASANLRHKALGAETVWIDWFQGSRMAMRHLLELGHRTIAHLAAPSSTQVGVDLREGYFGALREAGIEPNADLVVEGSFLEEHGYRDTPLILSRHPEVTALFAATDLIAVGAIKALKKIGRQCPGDISVVGFSGSREGTIIEPELTTVSTNPYHHGRLLAQQLIRRIDLHTGPANSVEVPYQLIVRESTASPRYRT